VSSTLRLYPAYGAQRTMLAEVEGLLLASPDAVGRQFIPTITFDASTTA
jgi:hypothetical protein